MTLFVNVWENHGSIQRYEKTMWEPWESFARLMEEPWDSFEKNMEEIYVSEPWENHERATREPLMNPKWTIRKLHLTFEKYIELPKVENMNSRNLRISEAIQSQNQNESRETLFRKTSRISFLASGFQASILYRAEQILKKPSVIGRWNVFCPWKDLQVSRRRF